MSTPFEYINTTGVIVPDTSDIQDQVIAEWREAFGEDLIVTNDTPQGVMIVAETVARSGVAQGLAEVANQLNPNLAGGVFLDAICALLGIERAPMTFTRVPSVLLTGVPGSQIPAGTRARTAANDIFASAGTVILDAIGEARVDFVATVGGPVPAGPGELYRLVDQVIGLETVSNAAIAPVLGVNRQSDASLRELRRNTLARQTVSTVEAQVSDLYATPGVRSLQFRENIAPTTQVIDGISMVAHSVWACVDGGTDLDVATSLLENKTDGAAWNGATTVNVVEPASGQTYAVKFARPTVVSVMIRVTVRAGSSTADLATAIPAAVLAYAGGLLENDQGFTVGVNASPFDIAAALGAAIPGIWVVKVEIALAPGGAYSTNEYPIAINQIAATAPGYITVVLV